jgi:hypothetical protein
MAAWLASLAESLRHASQQGNSILPFYETPTTAASIVIPARAMFTDLAKALTHMQVRDAGEDAWLGKEAPHDPLLDGLLDEDEPFLALPPPDNQASKQGRNTKGAAATTDTPPKSLGFGALLLACHFL